MRILLDASHQRAGGGLQVSHGVLSALTDEAFAKHDWHILAPEGSSLHIAAAQINIASTTYPISSAYRVTRGRAVVKAVSRQFHPDIAYTVFGPPVPRHAGIPTAAGMAYSNLLYPEIDFWGHLSRRDRWANTVRDSLRRRSVRQASGLILETEALRRRAVRQWHYDEATTTVIPPTVSPYLLDPEPNPHLSEQLRSLPHDQACVLLASGYHPNKNLDQIPAVAAAAPELHFLVTVSQESSGGELLRAATEQLGVSDRVHLIGSVPQVSIGLLYRRADAVLLISELESFSNNVIEAFATRTPLVVSDRDWAQSAAGSAAIYVPPRDPVVVAAGLRAALDDNARTRRLDEGSAILVEQHGTQVDRLQRVLVFLERLKERR